MVGDDVTGTDPASDTPPPGAGGGDARPGPLSGAGLRRHLLTSGLLVVLGRAVLALAGVALAALVARLVGRTELADYFLLVTMVSVLGTIGLLGLGDIVVRDVAAALGIGDSVRARAALVGSLRLTGISAAILALALTGPPGRWLAADLLSIGDWPMIAVPVGLWVALHVVQSLIVEGFRALHRIGPAVLFGGSVRNVALVAVLVALRSADVAVSLRSVVVAMVAVLAATVAVSAAWLWRLVSGFEPGGRVDHRALLAAGAPLMVNGLVIFLLVGANLWVLEVMAEGGDKDQVALYGAAVQLVTLVTMPLLLLQAVVPPLIAERYIDPNRHAGLERMLRGLTTAAAVPSLVVLACFVAFGRPVLGLVYGDFHRQGAVMLALLSLGQACNVLAGPCDPLMRMTGHQRALLANSAAWGVATIVVSVLLVPRFGGEGAAASSAVALLGSKLTLVALARRRTGITTVLDPSPATVRAEVGRLLASLSRS